MIINLMMQTRIAVEGAAFFAYHGYYAGENNCGQHFVVDAEVILDGWPEETAELSATIDYATLYKFCAEEMEKTTPLLETVAARLIRRITTEFPEARSGKVTISKLQPQLGGKVGRTIVEVSL